MLTKKEQLHKVKKPKAKKVNKNKPTAHEQKYLNWLQEQWYGCFHCNGGSNIEWHHVKLNSTDKKNHTRLIPLCLEHHKGSTISPHGAPSHWRNTYTMKEQNEAAAEIYYKFIGESF